MAGNVRTYYVLVIEKSAILLEHKTGGLDDGFGTCTPFSCPVESFPLLEPAQPNNLRMDPRV